MLDLLFLFLSGFIAFVLYPFWINFVYKFHMGEQVRGEGPQTHLAKQGTPTMGGLIIILSVALVTFIFNQSRTQTLFPVFVASLAGLLGLFEDFSKVYKKSGLPGFVDYHFGKFFRVFSFVGFANKSPVLNKLGKLFVEFWRVVGSRKEGGLETYQKFLFESVIAGFVSYWTYFKLGWDYIWMPLVGNVHIGILYPIFIFVLFIVVLNAVAFTDGLDGLAGGLSLIAILTFWVLARLFGYNSLAGFCATVAGALVPFLYFNVYPARIFMGNVGSHVLGATLAVLAVVLHREVAFLLIGAMFLIDGASSPLQSLSVKLTGKRIFRMAPIHHHFEVLGWPETKVTMRFWLFGIFFTFAGMFIALL